MLTVFANIEVERKDCFLRLCPHGPKTPNSYNEGPLHAKNINA